MAESNEAYDQLSEMNSRLAAVENSVAVLSDTDDNRAERVKDLTKGTNRAGRVLLVLKNGSTQTSIAAAYEARWAESIGAATVFRALETLIDLGLVTKSESRKPEFSYSATRQVSSRLVRDLNAAIKAKQKSAKP